MYDFVWLDQFDNQSEALHSAGVTHAAADCNNCINTKLRFT